VLHKPLDLDQLSTVAGRVGVGPGVRPA